jgi:3',5'-cyclic-AMP phosphodiesterase
MNASRRALLRAGVTSSVALALPRIARAQPATRDADFTFAHLTDMHVTRRRGGYDGYRACVADVNRIAPAFVLMGGDLAFDGLYTDKETFAADIDAFKTISDTLAMPYHHALGNHDVLGLSSRRKVPADDPEIGKAFLMNRLGWKNSFYSFDHGDWHFAILDSIYPTETKDGPGYEARIGEEQLHWLARDLGRAGDRPKVVLTHIAAFCNLQTVSGDTKALAMPPNMVLRDSADLRRVLERHQVKALLQGHSHTAETFRYNNVWYLTSPAVSSAWWGGTWTGSAPSYTLLSCRGEELTWEHRAFGWSIRRDEADTLEEKKQADYDAAIDAQRRLLAAERVG